MSSLLAKNTKALAEKLLRLDFYYTFNRAPSRKERSRISDYVTDIFDQGQTI